MGSYIDKDKLLDDLNWRAPSEYNAKVNEIIMKQPEADVVELKHGKWRLGKSGCMYFCSQCSYAAHPREVDEWEYCPICGTKMEDNT